jgi:topoisomerase IV subunit A
MSAQNDTAENIHVDGLYETWFLDYASYVILERAVPLINDGLKPVQRRILHAMKEMDDGRYNKVANIIGQSMQYHPHGDASIGDALVNLGQKDLLIDTQGNWGDPALGVEASAPRYIEARLSKFALAVAFNNKTTNWQLSYDGRKNEPLALPIKFPLLLAQGTEGIAVGLSTKILPHNFCELCEAAIKYLKGKKFELFPDFLSGAMVDVSNYNDGARGGKVRVRCHIEEVDKKQLRITDVPYGVSVTQLIDSIVKANDANKIKIKKVVDTSSKQIEILVELAPGISPDITIDALYAFTDCEISISPNTCVIVNNKPIFTNTTHLLKMAADNTKDLLQQELQIKLAELNEKWHFTSLEKIFFEEKIYKELEKKHSSWEKVLQAIEEAFIPYKKQLRRAVTPDDVIKLTEKPVRRIYKLDIEELDNQIKKLDEEIATVKNQLEHLTDYTITYYQNLLNNFGNGRERKTEIKVFENIQAKQVVIANTKLYVNYADGFIGKGLKKDEFVADCSDLDDIIAFTRAGIMKVVKMGEKVFIGKDIIHVAVFNKNDERTTYNMIYIDGKGGTGYAKRFNVTGVTRDKAYDLTNGNERSKVVYFSANANGEAEAVRVQLAPACSARKKEFDFYFEEQEIKGRGSKGNTVTKYPIKNVKFKEAGRSTLSGRKLWYDDQFGRLNTEEKGTYLGMFDGDDKVLVVYHNGYYEITDQELTQRFETDDIVLIERFVPSKIITCIYYDNAKTQFNIKRFKIETTTLKTKFLCIKEGEENYIELITTVTEPLLLLKLGKKTDQKIQRMAVADTVEISGYKTIGTKLADKKNVEFEWETGDEPDAVQGELF